MVDAYKERRDEILRIYADYIPFKEQYKDNTKLETLEQRAANIRDGKFFLLVAGEAKSGKSTFINAFLGAEILPMGRMQCTSALIEINYGPEITLDAEYANHNKVSISGPEKVQQFLKEHAAINDDYRSIPVTAINNEILIKSEGQVRQSEVEDLIEGVKDDNVDNLSQEEYEKRIWRYINDKKDKWQDIVIRINITYPFLESMREFTLVDSPGVNAAGKVGNITNDYIEKADAVIFVKALTGQSLESLSFRNFLNSNSMTRSKGGLLLLLTYKSDCGDSESFALKNSAIKMYRGAIKENQITAIDSKIQLFYHRFASLSEDEIENQIIKGIECDPVELCWLKSNKNRQEFFTSLQKKSGFKEIDSLLVEFAMKAHYQRLFDFLDLIGKGYETITKNIESTLESLKKSSEDPAKLKLDIEKKKDEIEEITLKMNEGIAGIRREYTDHETGLIKRKAEEEFKRFKQEFSSARDFGAIEKKTLDGQDQFENFQQQLREQLIKDCDHSLVEIANKTSISFESVIPRLTKEDIEAKINETKENGESKETKSYTTGACWWEETHHRSVYSAEKHLAFVKEKILKDLEATKSKMVSSLYDDVKHVTELYRTELSKNTETKQRELDKLSDRMDTAEKIREEIDTLTKDKNIISTKTMELERVKGGIASVIR